MGKTEQFSDEYQKLRDQLTQTGYICTGSITTVYRKCGKSYCFCAKDENAVHGPYNVWTRKVKGKTVTRNLTDAQAELCKECIQRMRKVEVILEKMKNLTVKYIEEQKKL
ncbi:MAG: hypothetical protein QGH62_04580 [Nitrospinaceae bacterium]|jgi:hypothetical protein|nr:hypothetical protein [Nitrospinaceae bacterium]|tara:strand:+ start:392 stop:721 length:330 start_codon:yes stop_codon:yes gene_type:complete